MTKEQENNVLKIASELGINVTEDIKLIPGAILSLAGVGEGGAKLERVSKYGAEYVFRQFDYAVNREVVFSRMVAEIPRGKRTETAYWTKEAPQVTINVHKGSGRLLVGDPKTGETRDMEIGGTDKRSTDLPQGCFYTIVCADETTEPLVVSALYGAGFDWSVEIALTPGQEEVRAPEGVIRVPSSFNTAVRQSV